MRVLLVDDHALFRDGLHILLKNGDAFDEVLEQSTGAGAIQFVDEDDNIDVVLLDYQLDDMDGLNVLEQIKKSSPEIPVIILSAHEDADLIQTTLQKGASGFITKTSTSDVMISAINLVVSGGIYIPPAMLIKKETSLQKQESRFVNEMTAAPGHIHSHTADIRSNLAPVPKDHEYPITERQMDVLQEMGKGLSNKEIARELNMSPSTVKVHVAAILKTFEAKNRTIAVAIAKDNGLITRS